jgi:hypothetical protein
VAFSFGFAIDENVRKAIVSLPKSAWTEAVEVDGEVRDGAWVAEVTPLLDLSPWPEGSRVIIRKERPHPGAQLSLFDIEAGFRHTAFITGERTAAEVSSHGVPALELRQRQHARVEDRIREAKAMGLRNLPCHEVAENHAWFECVLAAYDLVCWSKLICFADEPALSHCEIAAFRYRILHMAARITRGGRTVNLRLDRTWAWAKQLALAFTRLRAAFA